MDPTTAKEVVGWLQNSALQEVSVNEEEKQLLRIDDDDKSVVQIIGERMQSSMNTCDHLNVLSAR